jgi:methyl-accepting chemotaxis protein
VRDGQVSTHLSKKNGVRLSIGVQLGLVTTFIIAVVLTISIIFVGQRLKHEADVSAEAGAQRASEQIVSAVRGVFENAFDIVNSTNDSLVALKDENIADPRVYDALLKRMIYAGNDRYGAWFVWAAGSLDLQRKRPDGAPTFDSQGRFATYWHQNGMEIFHDQVPHGIIDSDLFRIPTTTATAYLLEPHEIDAQAGEPTLVTSFSEPILSDGKVIGVIGIDLKLDGIKDALNSIELPHGAVFTIVSENGVVAATSAPNVGRNLLADGNAALRKDLLAARKSDGFEIAVEDNAKVKTLRSWNAIRFGRVENPWYILAQIPEQSLIANTLNDKVSLILLPAAALFFAILCLLLAIHARITKPLGTLRNIVLGLGEGLFGYTVPHCDRLDEVGDIARAVDRLQESAHEIARLHEVRHDIEYRRHVERRSELDNIADRFTRSIEGVTRAIGQVAANNKQHSLAMATSSEETLVHLQYVAKASQIAKGSLHSVANTTASLLSAVEAIRVRTVQTRDISAMVEARTISADRSMTALTETVHRIDSVTALIRTIASQINLIALNATIEAARAGETGRGFAIVAQEIKSLAAKVSAATGQVVRDVVDVQSAAEAANERVVTMKVALGEMQTVSREIANALDVQVGATDDIRSFVKTAVDGAETLEHDLAKMGSSANLANGTAKAVLEQSELLNRESGQLTTHVNEFIEFIKVEEKLPVGPPKPVRALNKLANMRAG